MFSKPALRFLVLSTVLSLAMGAESTPEVKPVLDYIGNGAYRLREPPGPASDPVPPPSVEDLSAWPERLGEEEADAIVDGLVDRIEAHYRDRCDAQALAWLAERPEIRREFWLALDYQYDDAAGATAALQRLVEHAPERAEHFFHLAIACALVHDQASATRSSQYFLVWGIQPDQFLEPPSMTEIFDHFTDQELIPRMLVPPDKLVWPLLIHLADLDLPASERAWVLEHYRSGREDLAGTYSSVPYDYQKLQTRNGRIGSRPYTLANIQQYGGVCVDQAHFASRVMKALGTPAIKVRGEGRYGGMGHAWTGFLRIDRRRVDLGFTGRYNFDFYYTGEVFDPQTRTTVLDRSMAMDLAGALHGYSAYVRARALIRVARSVFETDRDRAFALTELAIDGNPLVADAWHHFMDHMEAGTIDLREGGRWINRMVGDCAEHPDLLLDVLDRFLDLVPSDDLRQRERLYGAVFRALEGRPDLQIRLRSRQCSELYAAGEANQATSLAVQVLIANASEGSLLLPLVEVVVEDAKARPPQQRATVRRYLDQMAGDFPKKRGDTVAAAWLELQEMLAELD